MAMGQQKDRQGDLMVSWSEMPRSPGHVFYDRLQSVLIEVAERLKGKLRIGDFSGRWGGDEFVVCLEDFGETGNAAAAAQNSRPD